MQGKKDIGVNFAVKQPSVEIPDNPSKFADHATSIVTKLAKGVGQGMIELPAFLTRVLAKMQHVAPAVAPAAAPAAAGGRAAA